MFQITEMTEAHVASVTNRTETHGDEKVPAVSIGLEITCANTILDQIDPTLRQSLFKAVEGQEQLPGIEPATPVLRCNSIDRVTLPTALDGWTLNVDDGIDETDPMMFGGVKVDKFTVEPQQGGSIVLRFRCGTSDIDAERLGKLGMHNGQSIWITLRPPEKKPDAIDGTTEAFERDHPEAGDMFAAGDEGPDEEGDDDSEGGATDVQRGENWPFPRDGGTDGAAVETESAASETEEPKAETEEPKAETQTRAMEGYARGVLRQRRTAPMLRLNMTANARLSGAPR